MNTQTASTESVIPQSVLTRSQKRIYGPRRIQYYGEPAKITATVRYDDDCGNGHNTFSITADITTLRGRDLAGGCCHEEVVKAFPELAPLIKWHLCSSDGPIHYVANTVHLASAKDCWGKSAGEPSSFAYGVKFNDVPLTHRIDKQSFWTFLKERQGTGDFQVFGVRHDKDAKTYGTHYSLIGYGEKWHEMPFRDKAQADEFCQAMNTCKVEFVKVPTAFSVGKERELDSARHAAIWPEATDEELTSPDLKEKLLARLPALMDEFKAAVESLGLVY